MLMKDGILTWLKVAGISLCAYLCVMWVPALKSEANLSWSWMIWFSVVTYWLLEKFGKSSGNGLVLSASAVGAVILPAIVVCYGARMSAIFVISSLLGVFLTGFCHSKKNVVVFVLSVLVMILYNCFVVPAWFDHVFMN